MFLPISWQRFEPVEGEFDYTLIDYLIEDAHENDLRLVILWFGSWKNTDNIKPILRNAYTSKGAKTEGSWEEVFEKSMNTP